MYIIYVFIDCLLWSDLISLCKPDVSYSCIVFTNYYNLYFIVKTHSVLCLLLSNDKLYIHFGGSLEYWIYEYEYDNLWILKFFLHLMSFYSVSVRGSVCSLHCYVTVVYMSLPILYLWPPKCSLSLETADYHSVAAKNNIARPLLQNILGCK